MATQIVKSGANLGLCRLRCRSGLPFAHSGIQRQRHTAPYNGLQPPHHSGRWSKDDGPRRCRCAGRSGGSSQAAVGTRGNHRPAVSEQRRDSSARCLRSARPNHNARRRNEGVGRGIAMHPIRHGPTRCCSRNHRGHASRRAHGDAEASERCHWIDSRRSSVGGNHQVRLRNGRQVYPHRSASIANSGDLAPDPSRRSSAIDGVEQGPARHPGWIADRWSGNRGPAG